MRLLAGAFSLILILQFTAPFTANAASSHRRLNMHLYLSNETIPVLELPKEVIKDNPTVKDAGLAGNELPPRHPLKPLTAEELRQPITGEYLAVCLVTSDRGKYVREWMDHHLRLGVGKFYVFDHNENPILHSFADLWKAGTVEYFTVPERKKPWRQFAVYETCMSQFRLRHQWIAFIDSDEFIIMKDASMPSLAAFLKPFEPFGGLGMNWRVFGSSGHLKRPVGSVVKNYIKCTEKTNPINEHIKSIVNTRYVSSHANNPHAFMYMDGYFAVNEHMKMIPTGKGTSRGAVTLGTRSAELIELYHYTTKSIEEYTKKVMRGSINKTPGKTLQWFQDLDASCVETCDDAVRLMSNRTLPFNEFPMSPPAGGAALGAGGTGPHGHLRAHAGGR